MRAVGRFLLRLWCVNTQSVWLANMPKTMMRFVIEKGNRITHQTKKNNKNTRETATTKATVLQTESKRNAQQIKFASLACPFTFTINFECTRMCLAIYYHRHHSFSVLFRWWFFSSLFVVVVEKESTAGLLLVHSLTQMYLLGFLMIFTLCLFPSKQFTIFFYFVQFFFFSSIYGQFRASCTFHASVCLCLGRIRNAIIGIFGEKWKRDKPNYSTK